MITLEELKVYLGEDDLDLPDKGKDRRLEGAIKAADEYVRNAVGDIPDDNPLKKELMLSVSRDIYDHGILTAKEEGSYTRLMQSMMLQLRLEACGDIQKTSADTKI